MQWRQQACRCPRREVSRRTMSGPVVALDTSGLADWLGIHASGLSRNEHVGQHVLPDRTRRRLRPDRPLRALRTREVSSADLSGSPSPQGLQYEVEVEDGLMQPLLSGVDVSPCRHPLSATRHILFPYHCEGEQPTLLTWSELQTKFPKGAAYLAENKAVLRARENGKFADAAWYRFGRNQNIGKQSRSKLCVPRLVNRLGLALHDRIPELLHAVRHARTPARLRSILRTPHHTTPPDRQHWPHGRGMRR